MTDFLEEVSGRVVLGDGDLSTTLEAHGITPPALREELNLSNPEAVTEAHLKFIHAGAEVLRTNSLHARAYELAAHGLENRLSEMHWLAAQLAKSAARGTGALVAGTLGQEENGTSTAYQARVGALLDGGSDLIFFENFTSLDELVMALQVKHSLHHCPAICSLAWDSQADFAEAFRVLESEGADVIGGPFLSVFPMMSGHSGLPFVILASEGDSSRHQAFNPDAYAGIAADINLAGGGILFGGEGITAMHIARANGVIRESEGS